MPWIEISEEELEHRRKVIVLTCHPDDYAGAPAIDDLSTCVTRTLSRAGFSVPLAGAATRTTGDPTRPALPFRSPNTPAALATTS